MKRLAIVLGILGLCGAAHAATVNQPIASPISVLTPTQVLYSTPTYAGQVVVCNACINSGSNVVPYSLCIATESTTAQNGYILVSTASAVAACK